MSDDHWMAPPRRTANRLTPEQRLDRDMSEAALSREVDRIRKEGGWIGHKLRQGIEKRAAGYKVADAGYPDWTLTRNGILIFAELKDETGDLSTVQVIWRDALLAVQTLASDAGSAVRHPSLAWADYPVQWYVWRPSDLRTGAIAKILQ